MTKKPTNVAAQVQKQNKQDIENERRIAQQASEKAKRTQDPAYQAKLREDKEKSPKRR